MSAADRSSTPGVSGLEDDDRVPDEDGFGDDTEGVCQRCSAPFTWEEGFVARYVGSGDTGWFYCSEECVTAAEPRAVPESLEGT